MGADDLLKITAKGAAAGDVAKALGKGEAAAASKGLWGRTKTGLKVGGLTLGGVGLYKYGHYRGRTDGVPEKKNGKPESEKTWLDKAKDAIGLGDDNTNEGSFLDKLNIGTGVGAGLGGLLGFLGGNMLGGMGALFAVGGALLGGYVGTRMAAPEPTATAPGATPGAGADKKPDSTPGATVAPPAAGATVPPPGPTPPGSVPPGATAPGTAPGR